MQIRQLRRQENDGVAAILFSFLFRKTKYLSITKLLYRHEERWYLMNGELDGLIDRIAIKTTPYASKTQPTLN